MDVAGAGMAQQPRDQRTDALSAEMTTLQERFDKLSDKLNDTQREVVQLRAELSGQGARLSDTNGRIGDVNTWLGGFALIITLVIAVAGVFTYLQAGKRAADEASQWIEKNTGNLRGQIDRMEGEVASMTTRMQSLEQRVKEGAAQHMAGMYEKTREVEVLGEQLKVRLAGLNEMNAPMNDSEKKELRQAEGKVMDKPEKRYTADDWNIRARAAYADKKLADAALYFGKVAESPDATAVDIAITLFSKGVVLRQMGRSKEAVAVYDEVVMRFGAAPEVALREQVARALVNKGWALGRMGRSAEEVAVYDEVVRRFGAALEPVLREQVAKALFNKGVTLGQMGRFEDEVAVYDEVVTRFGAASEVVLREQVATALVNKGVILRQMGRPEDAATVYDDVVTRFGAASEPALREQVAGAIGNRAWVSYQKGDDAALLADSERALEISPQAAVPLCNRAFALHLLGRPRAEVMAAYALAWQAVNDKARWQDGALKDLREHPRKRPGAQPVPADLIAAVAALAEKKE
jgi:tetratricopeptide (TPR) repeat protein